MARRGLRYWAMGGMFKVATASVNVVSRGLATIGHFMASLALPPLCRVCGCPAPQGRIDLCDYCRAALPVNVDADQASSREERERLSVFSVLVVPYSYAWPVDHCVRALKFKGERVYARVFGALLAEARLRVGGPLPQAMIPVPLHTSRYRERGFNQAHEIARYAARPLRLPVLPRALARVVKTAEQSGLPLAQRVTNVRGAFAARASFGPPTVREPGSAPSARPIGGAPFRVPFARRAIHASFTRLADNTCARRALRISDAPPLTHVALVDDVLTTGSTAAEAARVLHDAGVSEIELWAVARVNLD